MQVLVPHDSIMTSQPTPPAGFELSSLYILPQNGTEWDRLEFQHYLLYLAMGNHLHLAPIFSPQQVADVACGTGIWARHMAAKYPATTAIGIDKDTTTIQRRHARSTLAAYKNWPVNFTYQAGDVLGRLPQSDRVNDLTFMRLASAFVPANKWLTALAELTRVTRIGGWVEIVDYEVPQSDSPACEELTTYFCKLMHGYGLIAGVGAYLPIYLREAGLGSVHHRRYEVGAYHPSERRRLETNLLSAYQNIAPLIVQAGLCAPDRYQRLLVDFKRQLPRSSLCWPFVACCGIRLQ